MESLQERYERVLHTVFEQTSAKEYDADLEADGLTLQEKLDQVGCYPEAAEIMGRPKGTWG